MSAGAVAMAGRHKRAPEEIEAERAEKAKRKAARDAKLQKLTTACRDLAASFERRAAGRGGQKIEIRSASMRKAIRKVVRAAAESDQKAEREAVRIAEAGGEAKDRGTGLTRLKLTGAPVAKLIDARRIGSEEVQAAEEIATAFSALASRLMVRGMSLERVDSGRGVAVERGSDAKAVANYSAWAEHWSNRSKSYYDPMLEIIIAAVIDERPIRTIALDVGRRHSKVEDAVVFGLRDYAARAGMVSGGMAKQWMAQAEGLFVPAKTVLLDAVRRAKVER